MKPFVHTDTFGLYVMVAIELEVVFGEYQQIQKFQEGFVNNRPVTLRVRPVGDHL